MCAYNDDTESDIASTTDDATSFTSCNELSQRDMRGLVFHLLYAMESFDYHESMHAIIDNFNRGFDLDIAYDNKAVLLAQDVINNREHLDTLIKPLLQNWRFERIGVCTKLILRLALWELEQKETPATVVINEAIELAKCYAEKDSYKFINGILDEAMKNLFGSENSSDTPANTDPA